MNEDALDEVLKRLERLEDAVFHSASAGKGFPPRQKTTGRESTKASKQVSGKTLPDHIIEMRNEGFFKSPKTATEVHAALQPRYHCEPARVVVALLRLHRRKQLRKSSRLKDKKRLVAYVW